MRTKFFAAMRKRHKAVFIIVFSVALLSGTASYAANAGGQSKLVYATSSSTSAQPLNQDVTLSGIVQIALASPGQAVSVTYYLDDPKGDGKPSGKATKAPFVFVPTGETNFDVSELPPGKHSLLAAVETVGGLKRDVFARFQTDQKSITPVSTGTDADETGTTPASTTTCSEEGIQKLVNSVSQANLQKLEKELTTDAAGKPTSRHISQPGNQEKVDWMTERLSGYGLKTSQQPFTASGFKVANAVGRLEGTSTSFHTVGAHIDSIGNDEGEDESPTNKIAPGADDNASGIAVSMEAMRILKTFQPCMKTSIEVVGFNNEETGFGGSQLYAQNAKAKGYLGGYNVDMVGFEKGRPSCVMNTYNTTADKKFADAAAAAHTKYGIDMTFQMNRYTEDDIDSVSFWDEELPIGFLSECTENNDYHSATDTIDRLNFPQMTKTAQILVATLAELSMNGATQDTNTTSSAEATNQ